MKTLLVAMSAFSAAVAQPAITIKQIPFPGNVMASMDSTVAFGTRYVASADITRTGASPTIWQYNSVGGSQLSQVSSTVLPTGASMVQSHRTWKLGLAWALNAESVRLL